MPPVGRESAASPASRTTAPSAPPWVVRVTLVGRGHDLHIILVEDVKNIPVQIGVQARDDLCVIAVDVDLVGHAEVAKAFCSTNGGGSLSRPGVRSAATSSIASTCRHGVSYPIPTVVCRISPPFWANVL